MLETRSFEVVFLRNLFSLTSPWTKKFPSDSDSQSARLPTYCWLEHLTKAGVLS